ncbi:hypothetical protein KCP78_01405 [Salmonella enterica subsp. enterica]|nr:hypothetical protein KCP78_01405 [Salmonella enterica subsp. enterica]
MTPQAGDTRYAAGDDACAATSLVGYRNDKQRQLNGAVMAHHLGTRAGPSPTGNRPAIITATVMAFGAPGHRPW